MIFIMCGGRQSRWNGPGLKQMAPIFGEPIVHRTMRQLGDVDAAIVATPEQRAVIDPGGRYGFVDSSSTELWCDGFLSTVDSWEPLNTALLGDVFFTDDAMTAVKRQDGLRVIGRAGQSPYTGGPPEIFAMTWGAESADAIVAACKKAVDHARTFADGAEYDDMGCPLASLWQPYRLLANLPIDKPKFDSEIFLEQNDWTDDVDSYDHYRKLRRRLEAQFSK